MENSVLSSPFVWQISQLNSAIRQTLSQSFPPLWLQGEISNFTQASSGHWYFTLKDSQAQLKSVMFKLKNRWVDFPIKEGIAIEAFGLISMYEPRGELQFTIESIRPAGQGKLYAEFEAIKLKLSQQGLFDTVHKKPIPEHIQTIGIITSLTAAALQDVLQTLKIRQPWLNIRIYPSLVQGQDAPKNLIEAIQLANSEQTVDVLLLCRGGGSIEDLWAFNNEALARQIHQSQIPIISAVGHETDFTIADFVASERAATPTAGAVRISKDQQQLKMMLKQQQQKLHQRIHSYLQNSSQKLDRLQWALKHPGEKLQQQQLHLKHQQEKLHNGLYQHWHRAKQKLLQAQVKQQKPNLDKPQASLNTLAKRLQTAKLQYLVSQQQTLDRFEQALQLLNPNQVLSRGYTYIEDDHGHLLAKAQDLKPKNKIIVHFQDGSANAVVSTIHLNAIGNES